MYVEVSNHDVPKVFRPPPKKKKKIYSSGATVKLNEGKKKITAKALN